MNKEIRQSYNILSKVYFDKAFAGIELNKTIQREYGNVNSKLVTKIVYGVIEKDINLTYKLNYFVKKAPNKKVGLLLKMGIYIIENISSIPHFACVNEIVELAKMLENKHIAGFVNATLKNVIREQVSLPDKNKDITKYLSIKYSYPEWLIQLLVKDHNVEFVENLLSANLTTFTHIRILTDIISVDSFKQILDSSKVDYINSAFDNTLYVEYSQLLRLKDIHKSYIVQGLPSIIVAKNILENSKNVIDMCASPGGKSVLVAQENPNLIITSCDVSEGRVDLIRKYAHTYNVNNIQICINDATKLNDNWINKFDTVICDVPCSNLGIANKKPDVLLNRSVQSLKEITKLQEQILETASKYVRSGGILIYSTCSIMKEENEDIVYDFLNKHKEFKASKINTYGVDVVRTGELCTFYPHISNCEGFFIGRLIKE